MADVKANIRAVQDAATAVAALSTTVTALVTTVDEAGPEYADEQAYCEGLDGHLQTTLTHVASGLTQVATALTALVSAMSRLAGEPT